MRSISLSSRLIVSNCVVVVYTFLLDLLSDFWSGLLDISGFLVQFITLNVEATRGKHSKTFFTLPQYNEWKESTGNDAKGWSAKYYKGLGTSTAAPARPSFILKSAYCLAIKRLKIYLCIIRYYYCNICDDRVR